MLEPSITSTQGETQSSNLEEEISAGLAYRVLELVILAYRIMSQNRRFNAAWKENKFSAVLTSNIKKNCQQFSRLTRQTWSAEREHYNDDETIIEGEGDPDTAPRIDIIIKTWTADYEEIRFPFECKRIADNNSNLIRLYVEKGIIDRYLTEKDYSAGRSWGGMIAYILHGNHSIIASKLNEQIDRQRNSSSEHLQIQNPVAQFRAVYSSSHPHPKKSHSLNITHLLLSFPEADLVENSGTSSNQVL
jgi:hypothetical protein